MRLSPLSRRHALCSGLDSAEPSRSPGLSNLEVTQLYRDYGSLVLRRSRAALRDRQLARDIVQNVFVKLIRHGSGVRDAQSKLGYIYAIADRCCVDVLRRGRRERSLATALEFSDRQQNLPFEQLDVLARLLEQLEAFERVIAIQLYDGLTQREISQRLGRSRQTINKRVARIRRIAREAE